MVELSTWDMIWIALQPVLRIAVISLVGTLAAKLV